MTTLALHRLSDDASELSRLRWRVAVLEGTLDARSSARSNLRYDLRYAEDLIQTLHEPLIVLDGDLTVRLVNRSFYDTFRRTPSQTLGRRLFEIGGGQWAVPRRACCMFSAMAERMRDIGSMRSVSKR